MNKTINIPNKKVQPSPQFKSLVPGRGITLEEITQRLTKIESDGTGGGGQKIIVSPDMPTDINVDDFWYEVKQFQAYCSLMNGIFPYFLIVSEDPIEILEDSCVILDDKTYPINGTYGYLENLNMLTSEIYELLVDDYGFQIPTSIIGQYACFFAPERLFDFITYGNHSVLFKIGNRYSNIVEYECDLMLNFVNVGNDYSANKYLLTNGELTLEDLQNGSFNSEFFSFDAPTAKIDQEYAQQTGIGEEYIGLYATQLVIDETIPNGIYNVIYEYSGIEAALSINILYALIANTENSEFMLIMSMDFDEEGLEISLDGTTLTTDQYDVYPWCSTLNQMSYENYVDDFPALKQQYVGCKYSMFTINNLDLGAHTIIASNSNQSAEIVLPDRTDYLRFVASQSTQISMEHYGTNQSSTRPNLQVSKDKLNWDPWFGDTVEVYAGETLYIRGSNRQISSSTEHFSKFSITGNCSLAGNIMSLLSPLADGNKCYEYCFFNLFFGCAGLTNAQDAYLPEVSMGDNCCEHMFAQSNITSPMQLRPLQLSNGCYMAMYESCSRLVSGGYLPAPEMTDNCYANMFAGCGSLSDVRVNIQIWNPQWAFEWLRDAAPSGTVTVPVGSDIIVDNTSGVPDGWSKVEQTK